VVRSLHLHAVRRHHPNRWTCSAHNPRNPPRSFKRIDKVPRANVLYLPPRAVGHPNKGARSDAFQVMRTALPAPLVAGVVEPAEFKQPAAG
jgi:hypothetical protein